MPSQTQTARALTPVVIALLTPALLAETPKLNIRTKNHLPAEEQRKQQMERLAGQCDLSKYTITPSRASGGRFESRQGKVVSVTRVTPRISNTSLREDA